MLGQHSGLGYTFNKKKKNSCSDSYRSCLIFYLLHLDQSKMQKKWKLTLTPLHFYVLISLQTFSSIASCAGSPYMSLSPQVMSALLPPLAITLCGVSDL